MTYAALLLLIPSAGLPLNPTEITRPMIAGYDWQVSQWSGFFRLYADGRYEHRYPDGPHYWGAWEWKEGELRVREYRADLGRDTVYSYRLRIVGRWASRHDLKTDQGVTFRRLNKLR